RLARFSGRGFAASAGGTAPTLDTDRARRWLAAKRRSTLRFLEKAAVELFFWANFGGDGVNVGVAVALDDDFGRHLGAFKVFIVAEIRFLVPFLAAGFEVLDHVLAFEDQAARLVEKEVDVALAFLRHANADGRLIFNLGFAKRR